VGWSAEAVFAQGADLLVRTERGQEFLVDPKDKTVRGLIRPERNSPCGRK
jgi:hypothetical protein